MSRKLIVCGTDCSQMESLATTLFLVGSDSEAGRAANQNLEPLDRVNLRYLKKRNTSRLVQLLKNQVWTNPHRSALIFEVLHRRASHNALRKAAGSRPLWPSPLSVSKQEVNA